MNQIYFLDNDLSGLPHWVTALYLLAIIGIAIWFVYLLITKQV